MDFLEASTSTKADFGASEHVERSNGHLLLSHHYPRLSGWDRNTACRFPICSRAPDVIIGSISTAEGSELQEHLDKLWFFASILPNYTKL
jgi:hypothetical protein